MFKDSVNNCVGFVGNDVTIGRAFSTSESQTSTHETLDQPSQTRSFAEKLVQTEISQPLSPNYSKTDLTKFLGFACGIMEEEIVMHLPQFGMDIDEMSTFGRCKKLCEISDSPRGIDNNMMRVTLLLWKNERNHLYVGYSSEHNEWCNHNGYVRIYLFQENNHDLSFMLLNELVTSACITCMDIHPFIPHILAGGTFSGEVILWNTTKTENYEIATSFPFNSINNGHKEAVSQILWLKKIELYDKYPMLITSGLDGVIILWRYAPVSEELTLYARVVLRPELHRKYIKTNFFGFYDTPLKITCFSISTYNPLTLVAGMDGGHILCLGINAIKENMAVSTKGESFIVVTNPILSRYESHAASVTDVQHMKLETGCAERFATASIDRCIKIFKAFQEIPIHVMYSTEAVFGLFFWDLDPTKLIAWGCTQITMYDVPSGKKLGSPIFDDESHANFVTTSITSDGDHTFLLGKVDGSISAWKILEG